MSEVMLEKWYIHQCNDPSETDYPRCAVNIINGYGQILHVDKYTLWYPTYRKESQVIAYTLGELVESKRK